MEIRTVNVSTPQSLSSGTSIALKEVRKHFCPVPPSSPRHLLEREVLEALPVLEPRQRRVRRTQHTRTDQLPYIFCKEELPFAQHERHVFERTVGICGDRCYDVPDGLPVQRLCSDRQLERLDRVATGQGNNWGPVRCRKGALISCCCVLIPHANSPRSSCQKLQNDRLRQAKLDRVTASNSCSPGKREVSKSRSDRVCKACAEGVCTR